jgi:hypothetical protein
MRKILTIALALTMCSGVAMADRIGVFTDQAGTSCAFNPGPFALVSLYIVHQPEGGAKVSKFKVNDLSGMTATGASVAPGFLSIGTFPAGIEIAYPQCQNASVVIGTLGYFHQSEVMDCSRTVQIVAHPGAQVPGEVVVVDCGEPFGSIEVAEGGRAWGGADAVVCGDCYEPPLATQESTWGGIKALYR